MASGWTDLFPDLARLEPAARHELDRIARPVQLPIGHVAFRAGEECRNYLLVIEGCIRVQMTAQSGREIVLYRVAPGQNCVLTTVCLIAMERYAAEGIVEAQVRAVALPAAAFRDLFDRSPTLRQFVFAGYGTRIADLMRVVREVAFERMEARLARALLKLNPAGGTVSATHQMLAQEIGTAREVITRQLKDFEARDLVTLGRGRIDIRQPAALARLAQARG